MTHKSVTFQGQIAMSEGVAKSLTIPQIILRCIPFVIRVEKADLQDDKNGTDYWAYLISGHKLSVDVKVRAKDYGKDDLALEVWSVIGKKIGWTRDANKRTDYILWIWTDTGRYSCAPFPVLCDVFNKNWLRWCSVYPIAKQKTENADGTRWESGCVFVPRIIVWAEFYSASTGVYS